VTSSVALFEAGTWVKSNVYDKIMLEKKEKKENMEIKDMFT